MPLDKGFPGNQINNNHCQESPILLNEKLKQLSQENELLKNKVEELKNQLVASQKLEILASLTGGIAHDFNNILEVILGNVQLTKYDLPSDSHLTDHIKQIETATLSAREIIKSIMQYCRHEPLQTKDLFANSYITEIIQFIKVIKPNNIDLKLEIDKCCQNSKIFINPVQIEQVIINLCQNSFQAIGPKKNGEIKISLNHKIIKLSDHDLYSSLKNPGGYLEITVTDNGCGMTEEVKKQIFNPFFTTKTLGTGTGLGLSTCDIIIKNHQGVINVDSIPGQGTIFKILLPLSQKKLSSWVTANQPIINKNPEKITGRIFIIDDEFSLCRIGEQIISRLGGQVISAQDSEIALQKITAEINNIDLVITDYCMPEMNGIELARQLYLLKSQLPVILCTGKLESELDLEQNNIPFTNIKKILRKPYTIQELQSTIQKVLNPDK